MTHLPGTEPSPERPGAFRTPTPAAARRRWALAVILVALAVVVRWALLVATDPAVFFLDDGPGAWLARAGTFSPYARFEARDVAVFRRAFTLPHTVERADLALRAFRRCHVWIDGDPTADEPWAGTPAHGDGWRTTTRVALRRPVHAGDHVAYLLVENTSAPACVSAASAALGLRTDDTWESLGRDGSWEPARIATHRPRNDLARLYPDVGTAAARVGPWLLPLFLAALAAAFGLEHAGPAAPALARSVLVAAWLVLCGNNLFRIPAPWGFDLQGHLDYVRFIAAEGRLPLATDGWTMFQPPLFYMIAAACRGAFGLVAAPETADLLLRLIPMACGAGLIELCHRVGRLCFPGDAPRQIVALLVGGCLPIVLYQCQVVHNEPLAALLSAATLLGCLHLLAGTPVASCRWFDPALGTAWGLALLAKSTPLLLGPFVLLALAGASRRILRRPPTGENQWPALSADSSQGTVSRAGVVFGTAGLVAGWYFLRNWLVLGRPFIGGWDRGRGFDWWQDPGFRCRSQLTDVGTALVAPIHAGTWGLLDSLHSTLWTDGFLSGMVVPPERVPWNVPWLVVLAPLGLVPLACLLAGAGGTLLPRAGRGPALVRLAVAIVAVHVLAIIDLWIRLPVYSTAKASYLLGVVPALGAIAAAGAGPLLEHRRCRILVLSLLTTWAAAGFVAFFCVTV